MNTLFIDIASHEGLLACVSEKEVAESRAVSSRIRDHELIPLVEKCLGEVGWKYDDLKRIVCVIGPGGFTSLRIAVSFANTLLDQLGIEGTGVHLADLYFARGSGFGMPARQAGIRPACRTGRDLGVGSRESGLFWLHAAKRDSLFIKGGKWKEPTLVSLGEFIEKVPKGSKWMGELLSSQKEEFTNVAEVHEPPLQTVVEILPGFLRGLEYSKKLLEPWYGREG